MSIESLWKYCEQQGFRVQREDGIVDGVLNGVAFRAQADARTILLSLSLPDTHIKRLQTQLSALDVAVGAVAVSQAERGVLLTLTTFPTQGEQFASFLSACIAKAVVITESAYNNKHISGTADPVSAYIGGIVGALLGAAVGVIPWVLTAFIGWQFWLIGGLVGVGSFYGYRLLRGAHSTRFAFSSILVCSLLAILVCEFGSTVKLNYDYAQELRASMSYMDEDAAIEYEEMYLYAELLEGELTLGKVIAYTLKYDGLYLLFDSGFAIAACIAGVVLLRGQIQEYTHGFGFLRSRRSR